MRKAKLAETPLEATTVAAIESSESTDPISKDFVLAGHSIFTVSNPSGDRYTYRVIHKEASESYREAYFLSLLTGPDNTSDYTYMGLLLADTGAVKLTWKSAYPADSKPVKVASWLLRLLWTGKPLLEGYTLCHEGRCGRCGHLLTVPESVRSGYGPECTRIMREGRD